MKSALLVLALAACGDNGAQRDAAVDAVPDAPTGCTATFSGNFAETSTGDANCPRISGTSLVFNVPSQQMMTKLAIVIDLGVVAPGTYTEQTIALWNASATKTVGPGACYYVAGSESTPHGSFELDLTAVDPLHGALAIQQRVLARVFTDCGDASTETVAITF